MMGRPSRRHGADKGCMAGRRSGGDYVCLCMHVHLRRGRLAVASEIDGQLLGIKSWSGRWTLTYDVNCRLSRSRESRCTGIKK